MGSGAEDEGKREGGTTVVVAARARKESRVGWEEEDGWNWRFRREEDAIGCWRCGRGVEWGGREGIRLGDKIQVESLEKKLFVCCYLCSGLQQELL